MVVWALTTHSLHEVLVLVISWALLAKKDSQGVSEPLEWTSYLLYGAVVTLQYTYVLYDTVWCWSNTVW